MEDAAQFELKIAAAIAVLRHKPAGANAREYTQQFCAKLLKAQTKWRTRCLQAQDALLHLKQQKVICSANPSQDSAPDENSCTLSPPASTSDDNSASSQTLLTLTSRQILTSSYNFIHSVVNLSKAAQSGAYEQDKREGRALDASSHHPHTDLDSLMAETIPTCVHHLRTMISGGDTAASMHCIQQGLDGLVLLLNSDKTDSVTGVDHLHLLLKHLGGLVDDLLQHLFEPEDDTIQWMQRKPLLHKILLRLTTTLRVPERYTLLSSLASHAAKLCRLLGSNATATQPGLYESLAIALDCLQQGIITLKVSDLHMDSMRELQVEMEGVLNSVLVCRFPLVANTVLRLTSLIELSAKAEV